MIIYMIKNVVQKLLFIWNHYPFLLGYFEGIVGNLELMPTYYPGWIMRLYYDLDDNDPITQVENIPFYSCFSGFTVLLDLGIV